MPHRQDRGSLFADEAAYVEHLERRARGEDDPRPPTVRDVRPPWDQPDPWDAASVRPCDPPKEHS